MCSLALFPPPLPAYGETSQYNESNTDPAVWFGAGGWAIISMPILVLVTTNFMPCYLHYFTVLKILHADCASDKKVFYHARVCNSLMCVFPVPKWLEVSSSCVLALLRWVSSFHGSLFPHLTLSSKDMTAEFSQVLNWSDCAVWSFAWHPHPEVAVLNLFCLFLRLSLKHSVSFSLSANTTTLKHHLQHSVAALQWKPLCVSTLAVACHNCLLVWHVDPTSFSTRPSSGCAQVLSHPGHSPVTSMAWSPNGSLLVSASPRDTAMLVWDVAVESFTYLSWSPDGSCVLAATPSYLFRVWETRMWTCERWPCLKGHCQSGSWSPDGSRLLFSVQGETVIYALSFTDTPGMPLGMSGGPKAATVVADLSETTLNTPDGDMAVGEEIQSLAWDPTGERLAVLLKGQAPSLLSSFSRLESVFCHLLSSTHFLLPVPSGDAEAGRPAMIAVFKTQINQLSVYCWSNGKITHVPFCFMSPGNPQPGLGGSPSPPCPRAGQQTTPTRHSTQNSSPNHTRKLTQKPYFKSC
uniref:Achalasia, adrenocortical insufficiency, alacrimia n=1 Tax=Oncorhynchus kisutch TaxID=8019 RepID=A0A8C7D9X1_ONCKI